MDGAGCRFYMAFFGEYVGDLSKSSAAPTQFIDQCAIGLQARARGLLRQAVEDILKVAARGVSYRAYTNFSVTRTNSEQDPNRYRTNTEQLPNRSTVARPRATLSRRLRDSVSLLLPPPKEKRPPPSCLRNPAQLITQLFRLPVQPNQ